jgi:hypothetical protein
MRPIDSAVKQITNFVNTGSYHQHVYTLYQITASEYSYITSVSLLDHSLSQKPVFRLKFELWPSQIQSKSTNHLVVSFVLAEEVVVHVIRDVIVSHVC